MKATAATVFTWLFLLFVAGSSLNLYFKANARANRIEANLKAANETAEKFRTRNGQQAERIKAQELTISELRRINPYIISQLKNLYIPPRRTVSFVETSQNIQAEISAPVTDTIITKPAIIGKDPAPQKIKLLEYNDNWFSVSGQIKNDSATLKISGVDTVFIGIFRGERRRPGWWFLSPRQYEAAATNRNPYINLHLLNLGIIKNK